MRWEDETSYPNIPERILAEEKIVEAYYEGFISWWAFRRALDCLARTRNGTWMFEGGVDEM